MRNYKRKTDRSSWSERAMADAIKICINGSVGYMKASKIFNVPRSTLKDRIKQAKSGKSIIEAAGKGIGRYNTVFSAKQEEELKLHVIEMESRLFQLTSSNLRKVAYQFAEENNVKHHFNKKTQRAGFDWLQGFIARHPDMSFFINRSNKTVKWSRNSIGLLIDLYKEHECLYNIESEFYYNMQEHNKALENIARQLQEVRPGTTNLEVKMKLECLKSAYLSVKRKIETSLNESSTINQMYTPRLWYYNNLSFLANYMIPFKYVSDLMASEISTSYQDNFHIQFSNIEHIKTEELLQEDDTTNSASPKVESSSVTASPLVFTQLDSPYLIQLNSSIPTSTTVTGNAQERPPILKHYISPKMKRALENDPLEIPPADGLNSYEAVTTSTSLVVPEPIDRFISYISARMKRIKNKDILQELEDDILLKVMQAEKDDRIRQRVN